MARERSQTLPKPSHCSFPEATLGSTGTGLGAEVEAQYLAEVSGSASAMLVTQAHVVLCFAVATMCCFLEIRKGCHVVPIPHALCPC